MRKVTGILTACVLAVSMAACDSGVTPLDGQVVQSQLTRNMSPAEDGVADLTAGNTEFGFDLYRQLAAENEGKNVFISPHSVSLALSMAYAGAVGETAAQMKAMLGFDGEDAVTLESFNALDLELDKRGTEQLEQGQEGNPFELSVVNQAWGRIGFDFVDSYLDTLAVNFGAGMRLLDFLNDPDGSRVTINDWVEEETHDRIEDLLPEGSISEATELVLTNVIYFKASWADEFDVANTESATFNKLDGSTVDVDMMHKYDTLKHGVGQDFEYLTGFRY